MPPPSPPTTGALDLSVMVERDATSGNRGFGFLELYNNAAAEAARKKLSRPEYRYRAYLRRLDVRAGCRCRPEL